MVWPLWDKATFYMVPDKVNTTCSMSGPSKKGLVFKFLSFILKILLTKMTCEFSI